MCVCVTMMNGDTTEAEHSNGAETLSHVHQSLCPPSSQSLSFPLGFSSPSLSPPITFSDQHTHTHTTTHTNTHTRTPRTHSPPPPTARGRTTPNFEPHSEFPKHRARGTRGKRTIK